MVVSRCEAVAQPLDRSVGALCHPALAEPVHHVLHPNAKHSNANLGIPQTESTVPWPVGRAAVLRVAFE